MNASRKVGNAGLNRVRRIGLAGLEQAKHASGRLENRVFLTPLFGPLIFLCVAFALPALVPIAAATCTCFPCRDCALLNQGQLNFVIFDRSAGDVRLIPNIRFSGDATEFAIVVPTPSLPSFAEVSGDIWLQALNLTSPAQTTLGSGTNFTCTTELETPNYSPPDDGVIVENQVTVGSFLVTTVSSTDSGALLGWLRANNLSFSAEDSSKIVPLVENNWLFTTMKLDTTQVGTEVPNAGWNTNVDPVEFRFAATEFVVPLPFLSINRASTMPMVFYVVDDHRADLPGYSPVYANKISEAEYEQIGRRFPAVAAYLQPGKFLSRLDRVYTLENEFRQNTKIVRASSDDEVRRGIGQAGVPLPVHVLGMAGLLMLFRRRLR